MFERFSDMNTGYAVQSVPRAKASKLRTTGGIFRINTLYTSTLAPAENNVVRYIYIIVLRSSMNCLRLQLCAVKNRECYVSWRSLMYRQRCLFI